jgi:AcrR family transcriptional regulator
MRADARANRERILAAAEEVFGERGAHASTEEVARRAGVGIATVFRHFPTKLDLVEAALVRHFEELTAEAEALAEAPDPGAGFRTLVTAMVDSGATKVTLADLLTDSGEFTAAAQAASRELRAAVAVVLRKSQDAGATRRDVSVDELYFLVRGLAQAAAARPVPRSTLRRAAEVVLAGLAPGSA